MSDTKLLFLCRDAAKNCADTEQTTQRSDDVNTSCNVGTLQFTLLEETVTTNGAAATADLDSEEGENNSDDSTVEPSLHSQQYSSDLNRHLMQVCGQKRKYPRLTRTDQLPYSDHSRMDTESAENYCLVGNEHDTAVTEVRMKKPTTDKSMCQVCGWIYSKSESLEAHMHVHIGKKCMEHNVAVDTNADTHTCELCGMVFSIKEEFCKHVMEVHKKSVDDQARFVVPHTNAAPQKIQNLQQKENKLHKDDIGEHCNICGWVFKKSSWRRSLKEHMLLKHSNERPFKCGVCSCTFKLKQTLKRHEMLHANVRRFLCQYCAENFPRKVALMSHMYKHHADKLDSDPSSRPFSCRFCSEKFYRYSEVCRHVQAQHQSALCERCGRRCSCSTQLQNHVCAGAGDGSLVGAKRRGPTRPFVSNNCDKSFCFAAGLDRHMTAVHGTDNMGTIYKCYLCNEQFEQMIALDNHASQEHNFVRPQCTDCGKFFRLESKLKLHVIRFHTANAIT